MTNNVEHMFVIRYAECVNQLLELFEKLWPYSQEVDEARLRTVAEKLEAKKAEKARKKKSVKSSGSLLAIQNGGSSDALGQQSIAESSGNEVVAPLCGGAADANAQSSNTRKPGPWSW